MAKKIFQIIALVTCTLGWAYLGISPVFADGNATCDTLITNCVSLCNAGCQGHENACDFGGSTCAGSCDSSNCKDICDAALDLCHYTYKEEQHPLPYFCSNVFGNCANLIEGGNELSTCCQNTFCQTFYTYGCQG